MRGNFGVTPKDPLEQTVDVMQKVIDAINDVTRAVAPPVGIRTLPGSILFERDVEIRTRDGTILRANVYRASALDVQAPAIICAHPYGKDNVPHKTSLFSVYPWQYHFIRMTDTFTVSTGTSWEAPDPEFWVPRGYVLINMDLRGFGNSVGVGNPLSDQEAEDIYDAVEWAAVQPWCDGSVGLNGEGYLAMSQYKVAALAPPHLEAIIAWEGVSDLYRDFARPGGIRSDGFYEKLWTALSRNTKTNYRIEQQNRTKCDEWYQAHTANLSDITLPALICMSFSNHGLHSSGSFRAWRQINSKHKWLYTHRNGMWAEYYGLEALALQHRFFDFFLKKIDNGMLSVPPVRLEVRSERSVINSVSWHTDFPLPNTQWRKLYLNFETLELQDLPVAVETRHAMDAITGAVRLRYPIVGHAILAGPMRLQLTLASGFPRDLHIFAGVRKVADGVEKTFEGALGFPYDLVTRGQHRVAFQDRMLSKNEWEVEYEYAVETEITVSEHLPVNIQLLPSSTYFPAGSTLEVDIQGSYFYPNGILKNVALFPDFENSPQAGTVFLYGGAGNDSFLMAPFIPLA